MNPLSDAWCERPTRRSKTIAKLRERGHKSVEGHITTATRRLKADRKITRGEEIVAHVVKRRTGGKRGQLRRQFEAEWNDTELAIAPARAQRVRSRHAFFPKRRSAGL